MENKEEEVKSQERDILTLTPSPALQSAPEHPHETKTIVFLNKDLCLQCQSNIRKN